MGCGDEKLSKSLTQTFTAHCNAMICQQVTLSGDAEWPKVADAVIEAEEPAEYETMATAPHHGHAAKDHGHKARQVGEGDQHVQRHL